MLNKKQNFLLVFYNSNYSKTWCWQDTHWGPCFVCLVRRCEYYCERDFRGERGKYFHRGLCKLQPVSPHCFGLQVGRLLQQLAMTGSEEGDPRTKSSLGKFDKVRMNALSRGILFIVANVTIVFVKSCP